MLFNLDSQECATIIDGLSSLTPDGELKVVPAFPRIDKFMEFYKYKLQDGKQHNYLPFFIKPSPGLFKQLMRNVQRAASLQPGQKMSVHFPEHSLQNLPPAQSARALASKHEAEQAELAFNTMDVPSVCSPQLRRRYLQNLSQQAGLELEFTPKSWIFSYFSKFAFNVNTSDLKTRIEERVDELLAEHKYHLEKQGKSGWFEDYLDYDQIAGANLKYFLGCIVNEDTATCELLEIDLINAYQQPWNVFFYYPFGNFKNCPDPSLFIQLLFDWSHWCVYPALMTENSLDFYVRKPKNLPVEPLSAIARAQYALAPYALDSQLLGSFGQVMDLLRKSNVWHLRWV